MSNKKIQTPQDIFFEEIIESYKKDKLNLFMPFIYNPDVYCGGKPNVAMYYIKKKHLFLFLIVNLVDYL